MDRIFNRAEDKNVAVRVIYYNTSDEKYYYNKSGTTYTNEVPADDKKNLFLKGVVCDNGTGIYAATGYDTTNGITFAFPS